MAAPLAATGGGSQEDPRTPRTLGPLGPLGPPGGVEKQNLIFLNFGDVFGKFWDGFGGVFGGFGRNIFGHVGEVFEGMLKGF